MWSPHTPTEPTAQETNARRSQAGPYGKHYSGWVDPVAVPLLVSV